MKEVAQLTADDLRSMSAEQIVAAQDRGQFNAVLGRPVPVDTSDGQQITADDVHKMSPEQVHAAYEAGQLDDVLRGEAK